jgi:hypothetical protein
MTPARWMEDTSISSQEGACRVLVGGEGNLEQVELTVLGENELNKENLDVVKEYTSGVLLRYNASAVPAEKG